MLKRRGMMGMLSLLIAAVVLGLTGRSIAGPVIKGIGGSGSSDAGTGKIVGVVVDQAGEAVAEADVVAFKVKGMGFKKAKTGPKGGFELVDLQPGAWIVKGMKKGVGFGDAKAEVKTDETTEVKITLMGKQPPAAGSIKGVVVDEAGNPVAEASVGLMGAKNGTKTNEKGEFAFEKVKVGKHVVVAFKKDVGEGKAEAVVEAGKTTEVKIVLKPKMPPAAGKIVGVVVDEAGNAVAEATVTLLTPMGPGPQTKSGEKGGFVFENVKPGKYLVLAGKMGVGEGKAEAVVEAGKTTEVKIVLVAKQPPATGSVKGVVVDSTGAPVAEANVKIGPAGPGGLMTKTNEKGEFVFEKVKVGKALVVAFKPGVGEGKAEAMVEAGKTTEVKIELKK